MPFTRCAVRCVTRRATKKKETFLKTRHPSHRTTDAPVGEKTSVSWQSAIRRFLTDHQATMLSVGITVLLLLMVLFIRQRRQARIVQASEYLGQAQTVEQFDEIAGQYRRTPIAPIARLQAARIHFKNGAFQQALDQYEKMLNDHADHPLAPNAELGRYHCLEVMGRLDEALQGFVRFLETYPDHALHWQALQGKARCLESMGRLREARDVYEDFIALNPDSRWVADAERALRMLDRLERLMAQEIDVF